MIYLLELNLPKINSSNSNAANLLKIGENESFVCRGGGKNPLTEFRQSGKFGRLQHNTHLRVQFVKNKQLKFKGGNSAQKKGNWKRQKFRFRGFAAKTLWQNFTKMVNLKD